MDRWLWWIDENMTAWNGWVKWVLWMSAIRWMGRNDGWVGEWIAVRIHGWIMPSWMDNIGYTYM